MDVLLYFTFVTIIASLETDNHVEAACNTVPPNTGQCKLALQVISGTACYSGSHTKLATISCDALYSFDSATTFTCNKDSNNYYWTPKATATCLLTDDIETPQLTTHTMMSHTETMTSSTDVQIEPSTVNQATTSVRHSSVRSSTITASAVIVTPDPAQSREVKDADINAVYVAVPVVICAIALLLGVGILWWRRRNHKPTALFERREPGSLITNQVYGANAIDRNCSLMNVRQSRVNEYAEIPLDIINSDETVGDTYQTIDILPEDKTGAKKSYDNFKLSETEFIDTNYSHIGLNSMRNNTHADNTYSHTQLENVTQKPEITINGDDTYNKFNTTTLPQRRCQDTESSDTEYSHAHAGRHDPENEADNYSHLNTNMRTPGTSTEKPEHQCEDGMTNKNSNIRQLSAKDLPSNTGYEFAKDFDNLQTRSEAPEYAKVTKKKTAFNEAHNAGKGYETAVGTTHNYLILEPDTNPAPSSTLFKVVEDVSAETNEMPEAETGHEYFTLEKQDI
ncbi:uncharacterized protein LOC132745171 isoform X2 [Ruditapes philippinarum]|uniref:uncharacterized protein LOC132745171 isoform X2 n=1 Tax=Ruditapes philippinarum TaxID=129788 RepID=UPI00295B88AC|nr:uncharacterized protein LOC132745171 isoform X2 [Ruditapes philippinarum]